MERLSYRDPRKKLIEAARWLVRGPDSQVPNSDALAALGLRWEGEVPDNDCAVWPDNWAAVMVFKHMMTQWIMSFSGPVGLRYEALPVVLRLLEVPRGEWPEIFPDLRVMERAALDCMHEEK
ncbi:DUF1799 domain-containing protein [Nitrosovibrio sp. Nv6]|uniref:DUF1799 domain-containing protein n=1 Tax=Nitrosovibrio sp. Nv6 TaxID=1855340 RepID=UPI0008B3AF6C|nr:DUF1799 domain-containing protein [Nitrosovibrio sp. Nv6]SEO64328.1 Phage related hypothetical protein [Nitrosovibrio sp. Nv6]